MDARLDPRNPAPTETLLFSVSASPRSMTPWPFWSTPSEVPLQNLMHFRFYQDSIGRFLRPDNIAGTPANPQSWNRYVYCEGNPVNRSDPSGHSWADLAQAWAAMAGGGSSGSTSSGASGTGTTAATPPAQSPETASAESIVDQGCNQNAPNEPTALATCDNGDAKDSSASGDTRTPIKGEPNSTSDYPGRKSGTGTKRVFGPDGRAETDIDRGHDHGAGDPHAHDWDWIGKKPDRQDGRSLTPDEIAKHTFGFGDALSVLPALPDPQKHPVQAGLVAAGGVVIIGTSLILFTPVVLLAF